MAIRIITDSACDLPAALVDQHEIVVVPLDVRLEGNDPEKLKIATPQEFWQAARASSGVAETAAPSPGAFQQAFLDARDAGCEGVCCITISSDLSATFQSARAGAAEVKSDIDVRVIDSRFATMGQGLIVLEGVEQAAGGLNLDAVEEAVQASIGKTSTFGTLDTLEYLRRGGRIGSAQAFMGSLLSIKPIIDVRNGVVEGESKQRTRARSFRYIADKLIALGPLKRLSVAHADAEDIETFLALIKDVPSKEPLIVTMMGPVIGAHTGPGTVGVCPQLA